MPTAKTITLTLTKAQYEALADAVAYRNAEDEGKGGFELDPVRRGTNKARDNAWSKLRQAWNENRRTQ